jgi:hypothetical protein
MPLVKLKYKKNPHQKDFQSDISSRYLHLSSGFGGGKTYALVMKLFQLSAINKDLPGGLMAPSYAEFIRDVHPTIEDILEENSIPFTFNKNEKWYLFPWSSSKVWVATGQEKIRGPNWAFACINELTVIPIIRYKEVIGRVRLKKAKAPQIASNGTPEGTDSPYFQFFVEKPPASCRVVYGDTRDNADNLDPDYIKSLEESYDDVMVKAYLKGLWVNMNGQPFYYGYSTKNELLSIKKDLDYICHVAMDFNVDPMTASVWRYDGKYLDCFDEIELFDADTHKMCEALKARGYTHRNTVIYPDPAGRARSTKGQPDVEILKQHGYYDIRVKKRAELVRVRQLNVNNLLSKGVIRINPELCPKVRRDFLGVQQDPVTLDKIKKNHLLTHLSDGIDYMCDILFPFSGKKPQQRASIDRIR